MKKRKLLKQSKKFVAVVTAVALLDAPVAYAADTSVPETAQYQAEEVVDSTDEISSEQPESESEVQQTGSLKKLLRVKLNRAQHQKRQKQRKLPKCRKNQ